MEYCTIKDNHANGWGGGLINYSGTLTATGNLIMNNIASRAPGVHNNKGGTAVPVLIMRNNTVTGNVATTTENPAGGAGLYNINGEATLQFNTLINNSANWKAENIRLDGGKVTLSANIVIDAPNSISSCSNNGGTLASGGFNQISSTTCLGEAPVGRPDLYSAVIELGELDYNGGPTQNFLPAATVTNPVLDVIPVNAARNSWAQLRWTSADGCGPAWVGRHTRTGVTPARWSAARRSWQSAACRSTRWRRVARAAAAATGPSSRP